MGSYSVAEAKSGLPALIDKASAGERVIITRHGRPVVELRPALPGSDVKRSGGLTWLGERRRGRPRISISSLEVLKQLAEETRW